MAPFYAQGAAPIPGAALVDPKQVAELEKTIQTLLQLKRLCAQVTAIEHEVKRKTKSGRTKTVKEPTGDFIVTLFEGGYLPVPGTAEERQAETIALNERLVALVRAATEAARDRFKASLTASVSMATLKDANIRLVRLKNASSFGVRMHHEGIVPNRDGMVWFDGAGAHRAAQVFCAAVNTCLDERTAAFEASVRERLEAAAQAL